VTTSLFLIFGTAFVVGLSGAMMPGPLLAVSISESAKRGFRAGPLLVLGHAIVELLLLVALVWGLSEFLEQNLVAGIVGVVGGLFLLGMAFALLRQARRAVSPLEVSPQSVRSGRWLLATGAVLSVANPLWILWWATVGTTWVLWSLSLAAGAIGVVVFYLGHILSDLGWYSMVSLVVSRGKRLMSLRVYRGLLLACGVALIGMGIYFIITGATFLSDI
jgi:threonine/homoserine/homoserine lactone efflux protein